MAYAYAEIKSDAERPVELRLGSANANKIWLNGKLLADAEVYHAFTALDQYVGRGRLERGTNRILVKICQNEQTEDWAAGLEVSASRLRPHRRSAQRAGEKSMNGTTDRRRDRRKSIAEFAAQRLARPRWRSLCCRGIAAAWRIGGIPRTERRQCSAADDWLQFRGPASDGAVELRPICPPTSDAGLTIAWKVDLPGRGPSSPIVVDGRVIVTASSGVRQDLLHVLAFDAADGHPLVAAAVLGDRPHAHPSANGRCHADAGQRRPQRLCLLLVERSGRARSGRKPALVSRTGPGFSALG